MPHYTKLQIGDMSENGQITIIDEDRLCYIVKSESRGASGLRTISKALLKEFVAYMEAHPETPANDVRFKLSGLSDIDKYEYGYGATLVTMAKMILGQTEIIRVTSSTDKKLLFPPCIENKEGISGFLNRAIPIVLERDSNFSRLDKYASIQKDNFYSLGHAFFGRAVDSTVREDKINSDIEWHCNIDNRRYYLYSDIGPYYFDSIVSCFNEAYKGIFEIVIDTIDYNGAERKRYSLYAVNSTIAPTQCIKYIDIITAAKTKPFILLAGISGTGKSRIVRELAFMSCPKYLQDKDGVTPGNYCMIEVKPNWHDSTELLGYYSNISKEYQFKKFVKFLVKAKMHPEVPFFVCLDEMNLAPVEQYFAEILSILETRKHPKTDEGVDMKTIKTEVIVEANYFKSYIYKDADGNQYSKLDMTDKDWYETFFSATTMTKEEKELIKKFQYSRTLQQEGLSLPDNVIIIGTVNMDETTHQFSRKVIDRAMTIEMNEVKFDGFFESSSELTYPDRVLPKEYFLPCHTTAGKALESVPDDAEYIKANVPAMLAQLNEALADTPFKIAYRVQNELVLYFAALRQEEAHKATGTAELLATAMDQILMMKVLPRIEGDDELLEKPLERLAVYAEGYPKASAKIKEMQERLGRSHFTSFWP